jgi:hypothetical protein
VVEVVAAVDEVAIIISGSLTRNLHKIRLLRQYQLRPLFRRLLLLVMCNLHLPVRDFLVL